MAAAGTPVLEGGCLLLLLVQSERAVVPLLPRGAFLFFFLVAGVARSAAARPVWPSALFFGLFFCFFIGGGFPRE